VSWQELEPFEVETVIADQIAADEQGFHQYGGGGFGENIVDEPEAGTDENNLPKAFVILAECSGCAEQ